jgi:hypothetical protein
MFNFTDRFLYIPIKVYNADLKELTGKANYEDSFMKILPSEISHYKPSEDTDNDDAECTFVHMKSGNAFFVYWTVAEFEKKLNDHQQELSLYGV